LLNKIVADYIDVILLCRSNDCSFLKEIQLINYSQCHFFLPRVGPSRTTQMFLEQKEEQILIVQVGVSCLVIVCKSFEKILCLDNGHALKIGVIGSRNHA
jgi:hypothetical protein